VSARTTGRVIEFDEDVGLGTVRADLLDGGPAEVQPPGREYRFHCTEIADGSRTIAVGTSVTFEVQAGHVGAWEAVDLRPTSSAL
jgi:cold shock CspA family protein